MDDGAGDAAPVVAWQPGDKAVLHFRTTNTATGHVLDDTRKMHLGPFELRVGKSFLVEEWEQVVKTMKVGEKRKFTAADETVRQYPQLARVLRKESERKHAEEHGHEFHDTPSHGCFHHMAHDKENADLLDLAPGCLDCELELIGVEKANTFEKELWEMTLEEKLTKLPQLKEQGKAAFVAKQYEAAAEKYTRALALIENLANKQHLDPTHMDEDKHAEVMAQKPTFLSNLAACELAVKKYPDVILHCTMGLDIDPTNTKLLYRRAKAHFERGRDLDKADADIKAAMEQNPDDNAIRNLAARISKALDAAAKKDNQLYKNMFKAAMKSIFRDYLDEAETIIPTVTCLSLYDRVANLLCARHLALHHSHDSFARVHIVFQTPTTRLVRSFLVPKTTASSTTHATTGTDTDTTAATGTDTDTSGTGSSGSSSTDANSSVRTTTAVATSSSTTPGPSTGTGTDAGHALIRFPYHEELLESCLQYLHRQIPDRLWIGDDAEDGSGDGQGEEHSGDAGPSGNSMSVDASSNDTTSGSTTTTVPTTSQPPQSSRSLQSQPEPSSSPPPLTSSSSLSSPPTSSSSSSSLRLFVPERDADVLAGIARAHASLTAAAQTHVRELMAVPRAQRRSNSESAEWIRFMCGLEDLSLAAHLLADRERAKVGVTLAGEEQLHAFVEDLMAMMKFEPEQEPSLAHAPPPDLVVTLDAAAS